MLYSPRTMQINLYYKLCSTDHVIAYVSSRIYITQSNTYKIYIGIIIDFAKIDLSRFSFDHGFFLFHFPLLLHVGEDLFFFSAVVRSCNIIFKNASYYIATTVHERFGEDYILLFLKLCTNKCILY